MYSYLHIKPTMYSWHKFHLITMYNLFYIVLDLICLYFKDICIFIHKDYWYVILFPCDAFDFGIRVILVSWNQRRQRHPTPVLLPGKSHGRRSLVGCSPWDRKESDITERLHFHFSLSRIGEGNGNPLQCSRLENPRDGGAWWAAIYGVAQSQTRLKRLSSSSSSLTE